MSKILWLSLSSQQDLWLHWLPEALPLSRQALLHLIDEAGYSGCVLDEAHLEALLLQPHALPNPLVIAHCFAPSLEIQISPDGLQAWLSVSSGKGLPSLSVDEIHAALQQKAICIGIQEQVLQAYQGKLEQVLIAQGEAPVPGTDAWFEYLVTEPEMPLTADERIDFRQQQRFQSVDPLTPLMRRHPPLPGQPGRTVTGESIAAHPGHDAPLQISPGSQLAEDDPNLLLASRSGRPCPSARSVRVDEVLNLENVNYQSGHIDFKGSVVVRNTIAEGFSVKASGDILVYGSVEDAQLEAGHQIVIYGSMFGRERGSLSAKGDIKARYLQSVQISCLGNLVIEDGLFYCQTRVLGDILAGQKGGKGHINGGDIWAGRRILAQTVGSNSSTQTALFLGENPQLRQRLNTLNQEIQTLQQELEQILKSLIYLRTQAHPDHERQSELEQRRTELVELLQPLTQEQSHLRQHSQPTQAQAELHIQHKLYSGVRIRIGEWPYLSYEDHGPCRFFLASGPDGKQLHMSVL